MIQADRGCAAGAFFLWGGEGAFGQKRLLRISEKKEILRKPTVL
jgi:hypothetical protein